jgi:hypothetical protein
MAEPKAAAELAFDAFIESYAPKYAKAADCLSKDGTRYWRSTTSRPSLETPFGRPTPLKAPSLPCAIARSDRRLSVQQDPARNGLQIARACTEKLAKGSTDIVAKTRSVSHSTTGSRSSSSRNRRRLTGLAVTKNLAIVPAFAPEPAVRSV